MARGVKIGLHVSMILLAIVLVVAGVKLGDPRAVWFYCELLRLC